MQEVHKTSINWDMWESGGNCHLTPQRSPDHRDENGKEHGTDWA